MLRSALMDDGLKSSWRYPLQVDKLETLGMPGEVLLCSEIMSYLMAYLELMSYLS